jgi:RimJ/RimL family protein N-acetyltransferase
VTSRPGEAFERRQVGRALLVALKESRAADAPSLCIPVGSPVRALLRPLSTRPGATRATDVARLTEWRNRFVAAFFTEFTAQPQRTERWLVETIHPDDGRILFMIDHPDGQTFGHMGLARIDWRTGSFEADAIVRGEDAPRGLMGDCLQTLLRWAQSQLRLGEAHVRVRSDNAAVGFYERVGFTETHRIPLRRQGEPELVRWIEDPSGPSEGLATVYMRWTDPSRDDRSRGNSGG